MSIARSGSRFNREFFSSLLDRRRDEERNYRLEGLASWFQRMRQMQSQVHEGTTGLEKAISRNEDGKPTRRDLEQALALEERQEKVIGEIDKVIVLIDVDGTAVAFPEVLRQLRNDMMHVRKRLSRADTGKVTQQIGKDILDTLEEIVHALKPRDEVVKRLKPRPQEEQFPELAEQLLRITAAEVGLHLSFKSYHSWPRGGPLPRLEPER